MKGKFKDLIFFILISLFMSTTFSYLFYVVTPSLWSRTNILQFWFLGLPVGLGIGLLSYLSLIPGITEEKLRRISKKIFWIWIYLIAFALIFIFIIIIISEKKLQIPTIGIIANASFPYILIFVTTSLLGFPIFVFSNKWWKKK